MVISAAANNTSGSVASAFPQPTFAASAVTAGAAFATFLSTLREDYWDNISSTHFYGVIFILSFAFSWLLLHGGGLGMGEVGNAGVHVDSSAGSPLKPSPKPASAPPTDVNGDYPADGPQPKWHILMALNYFITALFVGTLVAFSTDARANLNDPSTMASLIFVWCMFLIYFFGFFGISFVDKESLARSRPSDFGLVDLCNDNNMKHISMNVRDSDSLNVSSMKIVHAPATLAPVCCDPSTLMFPKASNNTKDGYDQMSDPEVAALVVNNKIKDHQLEKLTDPDRAVDIRRIVYNHKLSSLGLGNPLQNLPSSPSLDYHRVFGANCETVVGYIPLPVGIVGPLTLNGETVYIPMATTEGCLVASTNRGCKAISMGSGATSCILRDGITRAPCLRMKSAKAAAELKLWCEERVNFAKLKQTFESTTSFGKLLEANPTVAGRNVYLRLKCFSGDAMGMNMVSKGSLAVVDYLRSVFPEMQLLALSGNMCTDKKAAAINWIEGRGKSVVVESIIPKEVVRSTLKTTVKAIVDTNIQKNLIGSAMAGAIGGFNAHASNIVTAVFLATGQDPAQNVESSNCITLMEETDEGDLWISCTMPSIEVGTVGGGTGLPAQAACLQVIGCKGGGKTPGSNSQQLAHVVASATMAGELSLLAALAANTLVQAHMQHNRKPTLKK